MRQVVLQVIDQVMGQVLRRRLRRTVLVTGIAAMSASSGAFAAESARACSSTTELQALVCGDPELVDNERQLLDTVAAARRQAGGRLAALETEQREWSASRDRCASDVSPWECVRDRTLRRVAALQARFGLIEATSKVSFVCDAGKRELLEIAFFPTGPLMETAIARRSGTEVLLWQAVSASGSRYVGPGAQVWLWHGEAMVRWGSETAQTVCKKQ
jgi:uncharacterized protein